MTREEIRKYLNEYGCIGYTPDRKQWYNFEQLITAIQRLTRLKKNDEEKRTHKNSFKGRYEKYR